jgi:hypothetical protein
MKTTLERLELVLFTIAGFVVIGAILGIVIAYEARRFMEVNR